MMDTLLPAPTSVAIVGDQVVATDETQPAVVGLRLRDGTSVWRRARRGQGPLDFASPIGLMAKDGNASVLDLMNRRIVTLDSSGVHVGATQLGYAGGQPDGACTYGERFLVADAFRSRMLVVDSTGVPSDTVEIPWTDLRVAGMWSRQVMLRSNESGAHCMLALMSGRGFAVGGPGSSWRLIPYIEQFEVTGLGERKAERPGEAPFSAVLDADFSGDTAVMLFAGRTADEYRTLDFYLWKEGRYLWSLRLPLETSEFAIAGSYIVARLRSDSAGATLLALRRR